MVDIIKELNSRAINENYKKELTENVQNIFKLGVISPTLIDILNKKNDFSVVVKNSWDVLVMYEKIIIICSL